MFAKKVLAEMGTAGNLGLCEAFGTALVNRAPAVALPGLGPSGFDPLAFGQLACALRLRALS